MPIVPYRLPELLEAVGNGYFVVIAEGEGKVDLLRSWGIPATCNAGGAGKWKPEHSAFLRGADVIILPDNDEAGRKHREVSRAVEFHRRALAVPDVRLAPHPAPIVRPRP